MCHHLHTDADPKDRYPPVEHHFIKGGPHSGLFQPLHRVIEGAYARQNDSRCSGKISGCAGGCRRNVEPIVNVEERLHVAEAVVHNGYHRLPPRSSPIKRITLAPMR
jgi:hypothetical protein